jgi:hypothetical protein
MVDIQNLMFDIQKWSRGELPFLRFYKFKTKEARR